MAFSERFVEFCRIRGKNPQGYVGERQPETEGELIQAAARTEKLLGNMWDPDYEKLMPQWLGMASDWLRGGLLTGDMYMRIFRTWEIIDGGETAEQFLLRYNKNNPDEWVTLGV